MPLEYQIVPLRVWTPLTGTYSVGTIASDMEHIGNRIAEGDYHRSLFWPLLARAERRRALRAEIQWYQDRQKREAREYASEWVQRWIEDTM